MKKRLWYLTAFIVLCYGLGCRLFTMVEVYYERYLQC